MIDAIFNLLLAGSVAWIYFDLKKVKEKIGG